MFGDHFEVPAKTRAALDKKGQVLEGIRGGTVRLGSLFKVLGQ